MIVAVLHILYSLLFGLSILVFLLKDTRRFSRLEYLIVGYLIGFGLICYLLFIFLSFSLSNDIMLPLVSIVILASLLLSFYFFRDRWESLYRYLLESKSFFYGYSRGVLFLLILFSVVLLLGLFGDKVVNLFKTANSSLEYLLSLFLSTRQLQTLSSIFTYDRQLILLGFISSLFFVYLFYLFRKKLLVFGKNNIVFIFVVIIFLQISILIIISLGLGVYTSDVLRVWSLKAKFIYENDLWSLFSSSLTHKPYPLLNTLGHFWIYLLSGGFSENISKLITAVFYPSFVGIFFVQLSRLGKKLSLSSFSIFSLFVVMLLGFVKSVYYWSFTGVADVGLALLYFISVVYLFEFFKRHNYAYLVLSSLFLGFCSFTKNEGIALYAVSSLVFFIFSFGIKNKGFKHRAFYFLLYISIPLVFFVPWKVYNYIYVYNANSYSLMANSYSFMTNSYSFMTNSYSNIISQPYSSSNLILSIIWTFLSKSFHPSLGFIGVIFVVSYFIFIKQLVKSDIKLIVLTIFFSFGVYVLVYFNIGPNYLDFMSVSTYRLISHMYPLMLFVSIYLFVFFWRENFFTVRLKKVFEKLLHRYSLPKEALQSRIKRYAEVSAIMLLFLYMFALFFSVNFFKPVFLSDDSWEKRNLPISLFFTEIEDRYDLKLFNLVDKAPKDFSLGVLDLQHVPSYSNNMYQVFLRYWYYPRLVERLSKDSLSTLSSELILTQDRIVPVGYKHIYRGDTGMYLSMMEALYYEALREKDSQLYKWIEVVIESNESSKELSFSGEITK